MSEPLSTFKRLALSIGEGAFLALPEPVRVSIAVLIDERDNLARDNAKLRQRIEDLEAIR